MIRLIAAGLCALMVALAAPATAQTVVSAERRETTLNTIQTVQQADQRVMAALDRVIQDIVRLNEAPESQFGDAFDALSSTLADARSEVRGIIADLTSIPTTSRLDDPADVQLVDHMVLMSIEQATKVDRMLSDMETYYAALLVGDEAKMKATQASINSAPVVMSESTAQRLRSAGALYPTSSYDHTIVTGTACFYDGIAAYYRVSMAYDMGRPIPVRAQEIDQTIADLSAAIACMEASLPRARFSMAAESQLYIPDPRLRRLREAVTPIRDDFLVNMDAGMGILISIHGFLTEERGLDGRTSAIDERVAAYEGVNADIAGRIFRLNQTGP